ncbi:MAG: diguanylate cyclase, partial [Dietzia sp.]|nr:diguanylate cyclase [Dietzia sp.]
MCRVVDPIQQTPCAVPQMRRGHPVAKRGVQRPMTWLRVPVDQSEAERLVDCAREPIRTPGTVQPHGVLVTADLSLRTLNRVSENTSSLFGVEARDLLGTRLENLTGADAVESLTAVLAGSRSVANPVAVSIAGREYDAIAHRIDDEAVIEFEPASDPSQFSSAPAVYAAILRLGAARTREDLWHSTARELKALTDFDRVMVYHFHPDDHGEVVAEQCADGMEPYLGLRYPASDVPAQARRLYLTKMSRTIFSSAPQSAPLLAATDALSPLDLSLCELRSVSPHHLQFMRNMGQESTLSLSLIRRDELVGMITCAHRTPRRLPYALRQGLEVLANHVSLHLGAMTEIEGLTRVSDQGRLRGTLIDELDTTDDMVEALLERSPSIRDLVPSDAAAISVNGGVAVIGELVSPEQVVTLVSRLNKADTALPFSSDALALDHPELATAVPGVAGALIVPYGEDDFVAWFRHEIAHSIDWLGDQSATNRATPLSPRNSFSSWRQEVAGQAAPWQENEFDGVEFGRDLDRFLMRRAESRLAVLGLHDALTGLPNRRVLSLRLQEAFERKGGGHRVAVLFVDLDSFKEVNDSFGHDVGDKRLVEAASRIREVTRQTENVVRVGGDEFVVL